MGANEHCQVVELTGDELEVTGSGILTGSSELARDIGRMAGAAIGAFLRVGEAFYSSGGLTGGNPWMKR